MGDERDPPIQPLNYLGGVTVINIGDVRVSRGQSRRHFSSCPHVHIVFDNAERRIWCEDCERDVEPFDAFKSLVEGYGSAINAVERREQAITEVETFKIRSVAAKKMDEAWRRQNTVPCCPHCHRGLYPEDFKNGVPMVGKDFARKRQRASPPV